MRWERLWADLAAQAEQWERDETWAEAAERARVEHGAVGLLDRLRASTGQPLVCQLRSGSAVRGRLVGYGVDWMALAEAGETAATEVLALQALSAVSGLLPGAVPVEALSLVQRRIDLRFVLRGLQSAGLDVVVVRAGWADVRGVVRRVGRDYVDVCERAEPGARCWSFPLDAVDRLRLA